MTTTTVTRRDITLQWKGRRSSTSSSIFVPAGTKTLILPLLDQLPDATDSDGFLGLFADGQYPSDGILIERADFPPIIIAHDGTNVEAVRRFAAWVEFIFTDLGAFGLAPSLLLGGDQGNETIVIHMRSILPDGSAQGTYLNLDSAPSTVAFDASSIQSLLDFGQPSSDRDFDYIEMFKPLGITVTVATIPDL